MIFKIYVRLNFIFKRKYDILFVYMLSLVIGSEGWCMVPEAFPGHGRDGEEPDGSGLRLPGSPGRRDQAMTRRTLTSGRARALYVCVSAEQLTLKATTHVDSPTARRPKPIASGRWRSA